MTTRRDFVKKSGAAVVATCCGVGVVSMLNGCTTIPEMAIEVRNKQIRVPLSKFAEQKELIVYNDGLQASIFIKETEEKSFQAFLMLCTHKVCELKATNVSLVCPCHGSEFSKKGKVLEGPAELDLKEYKTEIEGEELIIQYK